MKYEVLYQPTFSVVRVMLDQGEAIRTESGAMVSMSPTIELDSKVEGGIGKMFGRMLGGESMFQSTFTATRASGEVLLTSSAPGDIMPIQLSGESYVVTSGSYLAGDTGLTLETNASMKGFFGGEGLFMLTISGNGMLFLSSFGAIHTVQLQQGEQYIVDTGHLVAFTSGMGYNLKKAAKGLLGTITSGEGVVAEMTGPGTVYLQTRTPQGFAGWIGAMLPKS